MISDNPTIQRPVATGSLHMLAQSGASTPAPKRISNVDKFRTVPIGALPSTPVAILTDQS